MSRPFTASKSALCIAIRKPYALPCGRKSGRLARQGRRRSRGVRSTHVCSWRRCRRYDAADQPRDRHVVIEDRSRQRRAEMHAFACQGPAGKCCPADRGDEAAARDAVAVHECEVVTMEGSQSAEIAHPGEPKARIRLPHVREASPNELFQRSTTSAVFVPDPSSATTSSKASSVWSANPRKTASSACGHWYVDTTTERRRQRHARSVLGTDGATVFHPVPRRRRFAEHPSTLRTFATKLLVDTRPASAPA